MKETKGKSRTIRLSQKNDDKVNHLMIVKHATRTAVINDAISDCSDIINKKDIYNSILAVHSQLEAIEQSGSADTSKARKELMNLCLLLSSKKKTEEGSAAASRV